MIIYVIIAFVAILIGMAISVSAFGTGGKRKKRQTGYRLRQALMPRVICRWEPTTTASTSLAVSPSLLHGRRKQHPPTNNE